jgi:hypothetical protein
LSVPQAHLTIITGFRDLVPAPNAKKLAFVAHGEVFAARGARGRSGHFCDALDGERESDRAPDSKRVV